jgi:hypothetical protein
MFHTIAVRLNKNYTLLFLTGEDDIARFDSRQYSYAQHPWELVAVDIVESSLAIAEFVAIIGLNFAEIPGNALSKIFKTISGLFFPFYHEGQVIFIKTKTMSQK